MKKYIKSLFILFGLASFFGCSQSPEITFDELIEIGQKMKEHEQLAYSYQIKTYRSYANDTSNRQGIIYFERNLEDTVLGFKFNNELENSNTFYNGDYLITMIKSDSFAIKKPL